MCITGRRFERVRFDRFRPCAYFTETCVFEQETRQEIKDGLKAACGILQVCESSCNDAVDNYSELVLNMVSSVGMSIVNLVMYKIMLLTEDLRMVQMLKLLAQYHRLCSMLKTRLLHAASWASAPLRLVLLYRNCNVDSGLRVDDAS